MTLFRTTGPEAEPVTTEMARKNLRIDHASEDELIAGLIRAAREEVEAATGLALIDQTWRCVLDRLPRSGRVLLRRGPVREILAVTVYGSEGEASVLDPGTYQLDALSRPARLHFQAVPRPAIAMNGVEIDFAAGYGEAGEDVPDLIKRAILLLVAHWYEFRASFGAAQQPASYPDGYERLIAPFRDRRI